MKTGGKRFCWTCRSCRTGKTVKGGKALLTRPGLLLLLFFLLLSGPGQNRTWSEERDKYEKSGAEDLPVSGITPEEYAQLLNREVVIRGLDSHHGIRLLDPGRNGETAGEVSGFDTTGIAGWGGRPATGSGKSGTVGAAGGAGGRAGVHTTGANSNSDDSAEFARFLSPFDEVKPNFLYEGMFLLPVSPGEEQKILAEIEKFLLDFDRFEEIPYHSKYNGTTTRLFESFDFQSETRRIDGSKLVVAEQLIKPFEPYTGVSEYRLEDDLFTYVTWNRTPLYYKWMKGVGQEKMYIAMMAKAYPGRIFFYGLIGAKAFDFFGLFHGRLDLAFSGRAEAVFDWFHKEFVLPRLE